MVYEPMNIYVFIFAYIYFLLVLEFTYFFVCGNFSFLCYFWYGNDYVLCSCLTIYLSIENMYVYQLVYLSLPICLFISISQFVYLFRYLPILRSSSWSLPFYHLFNKSSIYLSIHLFIYLFISIQFQPARAS